MTMIRLNILHLHVLILWCALKSTTSKDTPALNMGTEDIMYHTHEILSFTCEDNKSSRGGNYNWYMNGLLLDRSNRHYMKAWRGVKASDKGIRLHDNEIVLEARASKRTGSTLFCTKSKGRYANNILKIYNLVRNIEPQPTDIGRHTGDKYAQHCPLHPNMTLTLNCEHLVKYMNITSWLWVRNDEIVIGETKAQLTVDKPGNYSCHYRRTHGGGSHKLLAFKVKNTRNRKKKLSSKSSRHQNWLCCSYNNDHVVVTEPMALQSSGAS